MSPAPSLYPQVQCRECLQAYYQPGSWTGDPVGPWGTWGSGAGVNGTAGGWGWGTQEGQCRGVGDFSRVGTRQRSELLWPQWWHHLGLGWSPRRHVLRTAGSLTGWAAPWPWPPEQVTFRKTLQDIFLCEKQTKQNTYTSGCREAV